MPEAAEVKIVVDNITPHLVGKSIVRVGIVEGSNFLKRVKGFNLFKFRLPLKVSKIHTHGKLIYGKLIDELGTMDIYFTNSLGMTGSWVLEERKHNHFYFETSEGKKIFYNDPRKFGFINFTDSANDIIKKVNSMGVDILSELPSKDEEVIERFRKYPKRNITIAMMNQNVLSGVGNYIKAEALYRAGISPWHTVEELSNSQLIDIYNQSSQVAHEAYQKKGNSFHSYKHMDGSLGSYSDDLLVYKQKSIGFDAIIKEQTPDGRNTYWCPNIQK